MSRKNDILVKSIRAQIEENEAQQTNLKSEIANKQRELARKIEDHKNLVARLRDITRDDIAISDHAVVRFLERVYKMDIEDVKRFIISDKIRDLMAVVGTDGRFPNDETGHGTFYVVVKNGMVITVLTD